MLRDTQAAIDAVKSVGPVGIIGFCLGGSIAFVAATRLSGLKAAIGYYGGAVVRFADEKPKVPTQLHFGEKDAGIPLTDVETVKRSGPMSRSSSIPARSTASIATSGQLRQDQLRHRLAAQPGVFREAFDEVARASQNGNRVAAA